MTPRPRLMLKLAHKFINYKHYFIFRDVFISMFCMAFVSTKAPVCL